MHLYVQALQAQFEPHRNAEKAAPMEKYMKNHFPFLGISMPERTILLREFLKENGKPDNEELETIVRELWSFPEREYHYIALGLLEKSIKKADESIVPLLEYIITTNSWWDSVDTIATRDVGVLFAAHPHLISKYISKWMASGNMWLQRICLLFQLRYKQNTDTELLFSLIEQLSDSKEFFIQKAIGWALREYAKTNAAAVWQFAETHHLAPLSKREALKHIKNKNL
ncbi:DNA alkylation repair protein [Bacillus sp. 165]|uniref:DNA alkylation repair protein n=1 Tax=Bacillus sp. 165 TaxID=1529117 RepID=UPI001ADB969B|nr:DNA alkylation repair protein [Bacillus sp. 165]MBO9130665.1 DNA alkylation repair protein [Bacillus sp. 165]